MVQRLDFKKKENINLTTNLCVFGWKVWFNRRQNCGFRSENSLNGWNWNNSTTENYRLLTHAYVHRLADVHLAGFAPAFTLSLCDSEYARKPPVPIASVVMGYSRNKKTVLYFGIKSLRNCPFLWHRQAFRFWQTIDFEQLLRADNSSQIFDGRK